MEAALAKLNTKTRDQTVMVEQHAVVDTVFVKASHYPMLGVVMSIDEVWNAIPDIREIKHIFVDGTSGVLSSSGNQLVTVQALLPNGELVPLAYTVINSSSKSAYSQIGLFLYGKGLRPQFIHVDFEDNYYTAFTAHFDLAWVVQCYFHLQQAVFKNFRAFFPQTADPV